MASTDDLEDFNEIMNRLPRLATAAGVDGWRIFDAMNILCRANDDPRQALQHISDALRVMDGEQPAKRRKRGDRDRAMKLKEAKRKKGVRANSLVMRYGLGYCGTGISKESAAWEIHRAMEAADGGIRLSVEEIRRRLGRSFPGKYWKEPCPPEMSHLIRR